MFYYKGNQHFQANHTSSTCRTLRSLLLAVSKASNVCKATAWAADIIAALCIDARSLVPLSAADSPAVITTELFEGAVASLRAAITDQKQKHLNGVVAVTKLKA